MPYKHREDFNAYIKRRSQRPDVKAKQAVYNKLSKQRKRDVVREAKDNPCVLCETIYPQRVMEFHHRDPTKKIASINWLVKNGSIKQILEEIEKCDLYCANCHALIEG